MRRIPDEQTPLELRLPDDNDDVTQTSPRCTCAIWDASYGVRIGPNM